MTIFDRLLIVFWLVFFVYWFISALGAKKNVRGTLWGRNIGIRLLLVIFALLVIRLPIFQGFFEYNTLFFSTPLLASIGLALCVLGFSFAIWARLHLGRNWGMPMSLKENPELVTTGPYAYVRHPIYTGFLLAMLGSIFGGGIAWIILWVIFFLYFFYSAKTEEKIMTKQFPNEYPAYKMRTKMLIPFVV